MFIVPQVLTMVVLTCGQVAYDTGMPFSMSRRGVYFILAIFLVAASISGWLLYRTFHTTKITIDAPMQKALALVSTITSYSQQVDTQVKFPDRLLKITGIYAVDTPNKNYLSYSTTTLLIAGDPREHTFTHQDISIGDTVYNKVETSDPLLKSSIKSNPSWRSFKSNAIPASLANIIIAGPIQDNLAILSKNGAFLSLIKKSSQVAWDGNTFLRYTFTLSSNVSKVGNGPLSAIVGRIGPGTIDVWINPSTYLVQHMVFTNGSYISTTTIGSVNTPLFITAPKSFTL